MQRRCDSIKVLCPSSTGISAFAKHLDLFLFSLRLKQLSEEPYTQEEAERAAGMGSYIPPKKIEVHTQPLDEMDESS